VTDPTKPTLLIVDGHSLAYRAFFALPVDSFVTRDGQHTNAIHGFLSMLISLLGKEQPTHLAIAFDISRFSFRTREYPEYKATRDETPSEFKGQVPLLQEALAAMGIPTVTKEDFEADDILATFARQGREAGMNVLVVSGDRDTIQLVNEDVTLLYPSVRGVSELKRYDQAAVMERYGIRPEQYPEIAALVGETSDNLPGVPKVGEKTAVKWINQFGSLEALLERADEVTGKVGESLREHRGNAERNRRLNRLVNDVELPIGPNDVERKPMDTAAVREVFGRLQFRTLLERVLKVAASEGAIDAGEAGEESGATVPTVRELVDEELATWLAKATAGEARLGLQVSHGADGALHGFGLAAAKDSVWVPWGAHRPDYEALEAWIASDAPKVVVDAKPQIKALRAIGVELGGLASDTRIAGHLLNPGQPWKGFEQQVYDSLGETLSAGDPNQLVPVEEPLSPATQAWYALRVAEQLDGRLSAGSLRVLRDIELPLVAVLAAMEQDGIAVDGAGLAEQRAALTLRIDDLARRAYAEIGHEVNLGSPKQLQQVLFEELAMPKTRANKTGYSTDAAALADLRDKTEHPFLSLLLEHRDAAKLRQIIETLEKTVGDDGRIRTSYDQGGASTGRLSSTEPNLQNIPVKTEDGRRIRSAFRAGEHAEVLLTADYSQIEMRIMAHLSQDAGLIEAFNAGEDLHRFVGARIFHVDPADVTPMQRTKVKAMSYGLAYGLSAFGLSKQLRIETGEAKQLMEDYFARFGAVREYLRGVVGKAKEDGYTETIFGRRRPFPDLNSSNRVLRENAERAALNAPIQGSAADIVKVAMLGVDRALREEGLASRMLLQVHDELLFDVAPGETEALTALVRREMAGAAQLAVPLDVQVGTGENWDRAAH